MTTKMYLQNILKPHQPMEIGDMLTIGSDRTCHWRIEGDGTSARHARIELKTEGYLLRDLRSPGGTKLNGEYISEAYLSDGDIIEIGLHQATFTNDPKRTDIGLGLSSKNVAWNSILYRLGPVAKTDFSVLLLGASGSGKEVVARSLHENSSRHQGPFVSVNCSALAENLIESELFGHIKGSFTGAINDRKGAFESARGGTLFLDEIGDLPYSLQAKLLRALENQEIRPVGADKTIQTDVRIIAATHKNLTKKVVENQFRSDLYYRLAVITANMPTLLERIEDFEDLLYQFAKQYKVSFSTAAIEKMKTHEWPGNIRELKNTVARASAMFPKLRIEPEHVELLIDKIFTPQKTPAEQAVPDTKLPPIKEYERQMIVKKLLAFNGNQRKAAKDLGMAKSTLHDRIKYYNIDVNTLIQTALGLAKV